MEGLSFSQGGIAGKIVWLNYKKNRLRLKQTGTVFLANPSIGSLHAKLYALSWRESIRESVATRASLRQTA